LKKKPYYQSTHSKSSLLLSTSNGAYAQCRIMQQSDDCWDSTSKEWNPGRWLAEGLDSKYKHWLVVSNTFLPPRKTHACRQLRAQSSAWASTHVPESISLCCRFSRLLLLSSETPGLCMLPRCQRTEGAAFQLLAWYHIVR
jgi:hypothetical protein